MNIESTVLFNVYIVYQANRLRTRKIYTDKGVVDTKNEIYTKTRAHNMTTDEMHGTVGLAKHRLIVFFFFKNVLVLKSFVRHPFILFSF